MQLHNFGGILQFVVADADDLAAIDQLDPARWAATSAPLSDLHCDPVLLRGLDPAGSGRLQVAQLVAARDWLFERLAGRDRLAQRVPTIHLADFADYGEGLQLRLAAEELLSVLGEPVADAVDLSQVRAAMVHGGDLANLAALERLLLLHRWILDLTNNLINFSAIYDPAQLALVDIGTLIIDGRRLEFCLPVIDREAHKRVAASGLLFLVYAEVYDQHGGPSVLQLVAPVTDGERGRLRIGKRGLFIDNQGIQRDAVLVDVVEHPISVREAARAPFVRAGQWLSGKVDQFLAMDLLADKPPEKPADKPADAGAKPPEKTPETPSAPSSLNALIVGGAMAFAGLGAALAGLLHTLTTLRGWLAILAISATVASVAGLLGWLKLRRRDMSLLLEANGWAVNLDMPVTRRIGAFFTRVPPWPTGAVTVRRDLLAAYTADEDNRRRKSLVVLILLLATAVAAALLARFFSPS